MRRLYDRAGRKGPKDFMLLLFSPIAHVAAYVRNKLRGAGREYQSRAKMARSQRPLDHGKDIHAYLDSL